MKTIKNYIVPVAILLFIGLLWMYLQQTQQFIFHYREQHQLFLNDYDSLKPMLTAIGGLAQVCAMFLVQFFSEGSWGALITACLGGAISLFLWLGIKRLLDAPLYCLPLCFIPPLLQISA